MPQSHARARAGMPALQSTLLRSRTWRFVPRRRGNSRATRLRSSTRDSASHSRRPLQSSSRPIPVSPSPRRPSIFARPSQPRTNIRRQYVFAMRRRARSTKAPIRSSGLSSLATSCATDRSTTRLIASTPMDVRLNEEQVMIRETVRDLARERIAPRAADIDRTGEFPWDVVELFRKHDLFALPFPPEYGGLSGSALTLNLAIEEIAKVCATSALILIVQALGGYPLMIAGSDEQKARLLPDLASGAKLCAYALTEPGAGSDPAGMETRAERHGDEYVITGTKIWITTGGIADTMTVFAKTDPNERAKGVSAFILEDAQHLKGFSANTIHGKLGIRGSNTAAPQFDEVVVPAANRLGEEGAGFRIAMQVLDRFRDRKSGVWA